jgi:SAM-dependent methyltransferase
MSRYGDYTEQPFIAELYDSLPLTTERADLDFFLGVAGETGGPVLDLACGTGRVLIPLAAAGFAVVGLDLSSHMLARCRQKLGWQPAAVQQRVRLVEANMTEFELGEHFPLAIVPFRSFQLLLSVEEQLTCLACIRRHLAPGGKLVLTFFQTELPRTYDPIFQQETEVMPEKTLPDGRRLRLSERIVTFRRAEQCNHVELFYTLTHPDGRAERLRQKLSVRYFFPFEVKHLLTRAGFRVLDVYGDYDKSPLTEESPEMVFVGEALPSGASRKKGR